MRSARLNRRHFLGAALAAAALPPRAAAQTPEAASAAASLGDWLARAEAQAREAGVPDSALREARAGLAFNADLVRPAGAAAESRRVGQYIDTLIRREGPIARDKSAANPRLAEIEAAYGVPASVLVAFWGRETSYGAVMGGHDVFSTLATRGAANLGRTDWMREYVAALTMIAQGMRPRPLMTGSASGALGHTQLMPSNVLLYGEDFDGDGRVDLWGGSPMDAIASAARHVQAAPVTSALPQEAQRPWKTGQSWIMPVRLPSGFDFATTEVDETRLSPAGWRALGVAPLHEDWRAADEAADAKLALPAGVAGPALLLPGNFDVFEAYNPSRTYALAVALLARHIEGGAPLAWPEESPLTLEERQSAQRGLTVLGHYDGPIDGDLGAGSRRAIRAWQRAQGRAADGYLTAETARTLSAAAPR